MFQQPLAFTPEKYLEEIAEENYQRMIAEQEKQEYNEKVKTEMRKIDPHTNEEADALQKKKQRDWDDWKAQNPAGTGNLNGR